MKEEWKVVYDHYVVSNLGMVRRIDGEPIRFMRKRDIIYFITENMCGRKIRTVHETVAMAFMKYNKKSGALVHHIDNDISNNALYNLKIVTKSKNPTEYKRSIDKFLTGYNGVFWSKARRKWVSNIYLNDNTYYLGAFNSENDAMYAYYEGLNNIDYVVDGTYNFLDPILNLKKKTSGYGERSFPDYAEWCFINRCMCRMPQDQRTTDHIIITERRLTTILDYLSKDGRDIIFWNELDKNSMWLGNYKKYKPKSMTIDQQDVIKPIESTSKPTISNNLFGRLIKKPTPDDTIVLNTPIKKTHTKGTTQLPNGKWKAQIYHNGKTHHIGTFPTEEEARAAYLSARNNLNKSILSTI
jgi:hypothetical protein